MVYLSDGRTEEFQRGIEDRQRELHNAAGVLARAALSRRVAAGVSKVLTIVLGAVAATQGVATRVAGDNDPVVLVLYTAVGVIIAAAAGIEAAFKLEKKATELNILAAECQSIIWQIDSVWRQTVSSASGDDRVNGARALLTRQDVALADIQKRAAQSDVNIAGHLRQMYPEGDPPATA